MIIGISGKSGSGKSTLALELSRELDYKLIDIDQLVRVILERYKEEILNFIEDRSILIDGKIDSKKLGAILFEDKFLMNKYNELIYSFLKGMIDEEVKEFKNVIIDSMFLPIMDVFTICDFKVLTICEDMARLKRLETRDNATLEYIKKRESHSLNYNYEDFDLIIDTTKSYDLSLIIDKIKKAR